METFAAVGIFLALIGPLVIAHAGELVKKGPRRLPLLLAVQGGLLLLVVVVIWLARTTEGLDWQDVGLKELSFKSVALGGALAAFFVYLYGPAAFWLLSRLRFGGFERGLSKLAGLPVWYLLVAVVIGGFAEEVLYRGYAFERISAHTGSLWLAALVPLLLFSLAHVPLWGWAAAGSMALSGGVLTAWYAWHRDLTANVIAHCITDFVGIVLPQARQAMRAKRGDAC